MSFVALEPTGKMNDGLFGDALAGLARRQKTLPSKHFYDAEGSGLFEAICDLPEYYVTRTEIELLRSIIDELPGELSGNGALVEFGSGASVKTKLLLHPSLGISCYVPIDISGAALEGAVRALSPDFPDLVIRPIVGDFTDGLRLPAGIDGPLIGFFPGSTIGNFAPIEAQGFLQAVRTLLGQKSLLLLGADLNRDPITLIPAYDDAAGTTAAFNKNILRRLNDECGAGFDLDGFAHRAIWNAVEGRMEMHLEALRDQSVWLSGSRFDFIAGETIHTENSYKYELSAIERMAHCAGWSLRRHWISEGPRFGMFLFEAR